MYGKGGLALNQVNYSSNYIEDYSYYLDQGFTIDQAHALFRREVVIVDESITSLQDLYDKAWATLGQLAAPKYTYECTIADLSEQTGQDAFNVGDVVTVYDEVAGVNIKERIVRIKRVGSRPQDTEVELANPVPVLENVLGGGAYPVYGGDGGTGGFNTYYFENENAINVSDNTDIVTLAIENPTSTQAVIGALIVGEASTTATVEVSLAVGDVGTIPTIKQVVTPGWNTIAIPKFVVMNSGNVVIKFSMNISSGTFSIPVKNAQVYILAQGAGGGNFFIFIEWPHAEVEEIVQFDNSSISVGTDINISFI